MPTPRKNVVKTKLSKEERATFEAFGRTPDQIDDIERRLQKESWTFWAKASELYMTLKTGQYTVYEGGKQKTMDESMGIKFQNNFAETNNRELAYHVFLSDPYFEGSVMEVEDYHSAKSEEQYNEFRAAVLSDPKNVERLKQDILAADIGKQKEAEEVSA